MRSRILLAALLALGVLVPSGAAHAALTVGMSDQSTDAWSDGRLRALGLQHARLVTPYDAALTEPDRVAAWLAATSAAGLTPHVAFEHPRSTRCPASPCGVPSRAAYARAVRAFIARFPQVRTYTTWNEANHQSQPVARRPEAVAGYFEELRAACSGCTIVAGDVLDSGSYVAWLRRFRAATDTDPQLWGLHNYGDVTYGRTSGTDAVLDTVPGQLWIEETGGLVTLRNAAGRVTLSTNESRAAAAIGRAFDIAAARPRITRMYVYHWRSGARDRFDAGLVRPDWSARPSYGALVAALRPRPAAPAWRAAWSQGRLVLRATCRGCRGTVRVVLRTRGRGTRAWKATTVASRAYRSAAGRVTLRLTVSRKLRGRARAAQYRRVRVVTTQARPANGLAGNALVRLRRP